MWSSATCKEQKEAMQNISFVSETESVGSAIKRLPALLDQDSYSLLREGMWETEKVSVYRYESRDFTFLHQVPIIDFDNYQVNPRTEHLNVIDVKMTNLEIDRRHEALESQFRDCTAVLEIGASEGAFLEKLHRQNPSLSLVSVEPDQTTAADRNKLSWLTQFEHLEEVVERGLKFDVVMSPSCV